MADSVGDVESWWTGLAGSEAGQWTTQYGERAQTSWCEKQSRCLRVNRQVNTSMQSHGFEGFEHDGTVQIAELLSSDLIDCDRQYSHWNVLIVWRRNAIEAVAFLRYSKDSKMEFKILWASRCFHRQVGQCLQLIAMETWGSRWRLEDRQNF